MLMKIRKQREREVEFNDFDEISHKNLAQINFFLLLCTQQRENCENIIKLIFFFIFLNLICEIAIFLVSRNLQETDF
jgi:hypothetical protein